MKGVNLELLRKTLNKLQSSEKKARSDWKVTYDNQIIRIIPYKFRIENPFIEMRFYYKFGKVPIVSPISYGDADPIFELSEELKSSGDRTEWKLGKSLQPKLRTYCPVIVRGKEEEGAKFWGFGKRVYTQLLQYFDDEDYGDITDVAAGTDLTVRYEKSSEGDYPNTIIIPKRNRTPMVDDPELMKKIFADMPAIESVYPAKSYEELSKVLDKHLDKIKNGTVDEDDSSVSSDAGREDDQEKVSAPKKTSTKQEEYADAFEDLFGEQD